MVCEISLFLSSTIDPRILEAEGMVSEKVARQILNPDH